MDKKQLEKYAQLLVRSGGNVQKGQLVIVSCAVDDACFGRMVQEAAYDAGACEVRMDWLDDQCSRTTYLRGADEIFDSFPQWRVDKLKEQDDRGAVYLHVRSSDPDVLAGVDADRLRRSTKSSREATKEHTRLTMGSFRRWSIIATPSPAWAKKVFPDLSEENAMEKMWQYLLKGARADGENPIADWETHKKSFDERVNFLNKKSFDALRITTKLGTDITIGLAKNHVWEGGGDTDKDGIPFFPNMPTEEIFTMPDRMRADGRVVASMPLSYQGNLIDGFEMTFKDGKVESFRADANESALANIIEIDEGGGRLGEVAIVSNSSPIGKMNTLFYNTLFDENASSHLALGKAYPKNLKGGDELSTEEFIAAGGNDSLVHVDFMFGTPDMNIFGIDENGNETHFYQSGEFVFN
ncbi:MAG: aminopeptidase [Defluviitaleaceae bacterium]|nr:aminopeptidase [Defluviitaleaceae bacterium]MCL2264025.1 aminopeptidase [Defluviitaleaceae bacterium]